MNEGKTPKKTIKRYNSRHNVIAYLSAKGIPDRQIADEVGLSVAMVRKVLTDEDVQKEVKKIRHEFFSYDPKQMYKRVFKESFDTAREIMLSEAAKPSVRLNAAQDFMDRHSGKSSQTVEVGGSMLMEIYEQLQKLSKEDNAIEVSSTEVVSENKELQAFLEHSNNE